MFFLKADLREEVAVLFGFGDFDNEAVVDGAVKVDVVDVD